MAATQLKDPLEDVETLVSETMAILGTSAEAGYDKIDLEEPPSTPIIELGSPNHSETLSSRSPIPSMTAGERTAGLEPSEISVLPKSKKHVSAGGSIRIHIKEPERAEMVSAIGLKTSHVQFVVVVDSSVPGLEATNMEVRRRFSEFDALHKLLHAEYKGCIIPPLPAKTFILIENHSDEFLRLRRADLQAFLRGVAAHPVLQQSELLRVFLLQPGDLARNPAWLNLASSHAQKRAGYSDDASSAASSSGSGNVALANLNSFVSWMKQSTIAVFQPPQRVLPPDEEGLRQAKELLQDLERLLQLATHSARTLCQDMEKMSVNLREFGFNMGMISKYEDAVQEKVGQYTPEGQSAAGRAADCIKVAMTQAKQHSIWKTLSLKTASNLVTVHDYWVLIPEAIRAMDVREAALQHVFIIEEELAHKKHQLAAAEGAGGAGGGLVGNLDKRLTQLSHSIAILEEQAKSARDQYILIKERNQAELSRIGLEREQDFRSMLTEYASNQAQLVQPSADLTAALARQLSGDDARSS